MKLIKKRRKEQKKLKKQHKIDKKLGNVELQDPNTQEKLRVLTDDLILENQPDLNEEETMDEFQPFIKGLKTAKILLTTNLKPTKATFEFLTDIKNVFPNSYYYPRKGYTLKQISEIALEKDYTHLLTINERLKQPFSITFCVLRTGPTINFRLRKYV